jgi:hypothetical protein
VCRLNTERRQAYEKALNAENLHSVKHGSILDEQVRAMDAISRAANAGPVASLFKSKSRRVRDAMMQETQKRIHDKCPELEPGWLRYVTSPSARQEYHTAQRQIALSIAEETQQKLEAQDGELLNLQQRYGRHSKMFKAGGVKLSLKNTKAQSKLKTTIEKAVKLTEEKFRNYKDFPPELKNALHNEENLIEDLVNRYEIIKPSEIDRLFADNQEGGQVLLRRIKTYFDAGEYALKPSAGAKLLSEMSATGRAKEVNGIRDQLTKATSGLRYSFFWNRRLSHYRSLLALKNPNASDNTKRQYFLERKPVAGARVDITVPGGAKVTAFTKYRSGNYLYLIDAADKLYQFDLTADGASGKAPPKIPSVFPDPKKPGDAAESDIDWSMIEISPT